MYRILDNTTGLWIKSTPWRGCNIDKNMLGKPGRVFKRRSDVSSHITNNLDFYSLNANRLEMVEYELTEVSKESMTTVLKAKTERDKLKKIEEKKRLALSKLRRIEELRSELDQLTGKN